MKIYSEDDINCTRDNALNVHRMLMKKNILLEDDFFFILKII